jgi:hypothetical protein
MSSRVCIRIEPDYEWIMIGATYIKSHPHAAGAERENQETSVSKHVAVDAFDLPLRIIITDGTTSYIAAR